uniref:Uncharacterized protein n=1 Tax=Knipowitschia caucasica TaxID=637954 RepID=A0AAV2JFU7_KNICA
MNLDDCQSNGPSQSTSSLKGVRRSSIHQNSHRYRWIRQTPEDICRHEDCTQAAAVPGLSCGSVHQHSNYYNYSTSNEYNYYTSNDYNYSTSNDYNYSTSNEYNYSTSNDYNYYTSNDYNY